MIGLSLVVGLLSCRAEVSPCECADAHFELQRSLFAAADDPEKLEKIYLEIEEIAHQCEQLSDEMGHDAYLDAIAGCKR